MRKSGAFAAVAASESLPAHEARALKRIVCGPERQKVYYGII